MKKLDLYIIKKFLGTYLFIILILMSLGIVFDLAENISDFIKKDAPISAILFDYYLNFSIYYSNLLSGFLIFISVILFTSKMAQNTEIIPILSSGISYNRFLRPYFMCAILLTGVSLFMNHYMVPKSNQKMLEFNEKYAFAPLRVTDIHREIDDGKVVFFKWYSSAYSYLDQFNFETWEDGKLKSLIFADKAHNDSLDDHWTLKKYRIRIVGDLTDSIYEGQELDTTFNFSIDDFAKRTEVAQCLVTEDLDRFITQEINKGSSDIPIYELERHQRTAYPFSTFILTLIGVSIASRKLRGGIGVHLVIGITIAALFILSMKITSTATTNIGLDPIIAVWLSNLIFAVISLFFFFRAQK